MTPAFRELKSRLRKTNPELQFQTSDGRSCAAASSKPARTALVLVVHRKKAREPIQSCRAVDGDPIRITTPRDALTIQVVMTGQGC